MFIKYFMQFVRRKVLLKKGFIHVDFKRVACIAPDSFVNYALVLPVACANKRGGRTRGVHGKILFEIFLHCHPVCGLSKYLCGDTGATYAKNLFKTQLYLSFTFELF